MISFANATMDDVPMLSELLMVLFEQEMEFVPNREAHVQGLSMIINNANYGAILIARQHSEILAMVNLLFSVSTALGQRVAILEDMVVAPNARGLGVGSALLEYAINYAQQHGIKRITLLTDDHNHDAQRFYAKHGFIQSQMIPLRRFI